MFVLSAMLLYALLLISVETRTFELAVHRMIGFTRPGLVQLLVTQAVLLSIPAWAIGLLLGQIAIAIFVRQLQKSVDIPINPRLDGNAVMVASLVGLLLPLVAVFLPIRAALAKDIATALSNQYSKTVAVKFEISRDEHDRINASWIVVGVGLVAFGFSIYYLLPLSLLSLFVSQKDVPFMI